MNTASSPFFAVFVFVFVFTAVVVAGVAVCLHIVFDKISTRIVHWCVLRRHGNLGTGQKLLGVLTGI